MFEPSTQFWLMMFQRKDDDGTTKVYLLYSRFPWGPWRPAAPKDGVIYDPADGGFRKFIHSLEFGGTDGLGRIVDDCGALDYHDHDSGGVYAPYMVPPWTRRIGDRLDLFFTMSTWSPYQVVLMQTSVQLVCA